MSNDLASYEQGSVRKQKIMLKHLLRGKTVLFALLISGR